MSKKKKIELKESISELKELRSSTANHRVKTRLLFLIKKDLSEYKTQEDLAVFLGVSIWSLRRWTNTYIDSGLDELIKISSGGKRREVIDKKLHSLIEKKLNDSENPLLSYKESISWIKEQTGIELEYNTVRTYMITNFKSKLKMPRKSHYKSDKEAVEVFKKPSN